MLSPLAAEFKKMIEEDWMPNKISNFINIIQSYLKHQKQYEHVLTMVIPVPRIRELYGPGGASEWYIKEMLKNNKERLSLSELIQKEPVLEEMIAACDALAEKFTGFIMPFKEKIQNAANIEEKDIEFASSLRELYKKELAQMRETTFEYHEEEHRRVA